MNDQHLSESHELDEHGRPNGGYSFSTGLTVTWQQGPLAVDGTRRDPNGAFVETVIRAAIGRLEFYQSTQFACSENANALLNLRDALVHLAARTRDRETRGVEGTHEV